MQILEDKLVISSTDLVRHRECTLATRLLHAVRTGRMEAPTKEESATLQLAKRYGDEHEKRVLERLVQAHGEHGVVRFGRPSNSRAAYEAADAATREALRGGAPVIYQATFFDGSFVGHADFLIRSGTDPDSGSPLYEPYDTKLARSVKPGALLQLAAYADQMVRLGAPRPERVVVWLGNDHRSAHALRPLLPILGETRANLETTLAEGDARLDSEYADPRPACAMCDFAIHCERRREEVRDLSLVAGIRVNQMRKLRDADITTVEALGVAPDSVRPKTLPRPTFEKLRAQARMQAAQDASRSEACPEGVPSFDVYEPSEFARLPAPRPNDVFFDMEGDAFAEGGQGLEYLFGVVTVEDGVDRFTAFWAHDRAEEKVAFERLVDFLVERTSADSGAHVYHYAAYEASALARLAQRHATRERQVDTLLREQRLVNLYPIVTRSLRISQRSYSIKKLEPFYMPTEREGEVTTAGDSILQYERAVEHRALSEHAEEKVLLDEIERYNERDCVSTRGLRDWLQGLKVLRPVERSVARSSEIAAHTNTEEPSVPEKDVALDELTESLRAGIPADPEERSPEQTARAVVAAAAGFHRREERIAWQKHFRMLEAPREQLAGETDVVLVERGAKPPSAWTAGRGNSTRTFELLLDSESDLKLTDGDTGRLLYDDAVTEGGTRPSSNAKVESVSDGRCVVVETTKSPHDGSQPKAFWRTTYVNTASLEAATRSRAEELRALPGGVPEGAIFDLLLRRPPRFRSGMLAHGQDPVADIVDSLGRLDRSYVAVQGPPGTGKTYVGGQVVARLVRAGWHVGVVAQSHAAVFGLLESAEQAGLDEACIGRAKPGVRDPSKRFVQTDPWAFRERQAGGVLLGGTAWTFAHAKARTPARPLDLLVVEEAGQFSLANTIAASTNTKNLLLLGDPRQLQQVVQAVHPERVDQSALGWLMRDSATMPKDLGYFLDRSRRMHPAVSRVVSELAYDGRLSSDASAGDRRLEGIEPGVHVRPIAHSGCTTESPDEVRAAVEAASEVIGRRWFDGTSYRTLGAADVMVVAPYNRQREALRTAFDARGWSESRVGTVDKFQGLEAPVVIVSMTTSSVDDAPRGLEFVLSTHRLNVAISRAQWAAYLLYSPALTSAPAHSPETLALLGGFLGVVRGGA